MNEREYALHTLLGNLLFPPRCLFCGALIPWEETLCPACRAAVPTASAHVQEDCFDCEKIIWCADYAGLFRTGMERFKFSGIRRGKELFDGMLLEALRESGVLETVDGIAYVPMQRARERRRGYNQAKLLAEYIAEKTNLPLRCGLLCRGGKGTAHGTTSRSERVALVQGSYSVGRELPLPGERLLLVDDIITTGTTLATCAALLRKNGAGAVYGAAPLRTPVSKPEG